MSSPESFRDPNRTPEITSARVGRVLRYIAMYRALHSGTADARSELDTARLAADIAEVVAQAPPLTDAQRERLSLLLGGVDPNAG